MKKASMSQLKNSLSSFLNLVREVIRVAVYDKGGIVAWIVPPTKDSLSVKERIAALNRAGLVELPLAKIPKKLPKPVKTHSKGSVVQALLDERRHGR